LICLCLWVAYRLVRPFLRSYATLKGASVLITGCDHGFGRRLALCFHALGANVWAGCLTKDAAEKLKEEVGRDARMRACVLDVTNPSDIDAVRKAIEEDGSPFAVLINNAGISAFGFSELLPLQRYRQNMEVNYFGTVRMTQAMLPLLRASKGRIVNMGSIGARMPSAFGSAYLSTKAAMVSYSECVRQEVHRFGVRVSLVEPGFFATGLLDLGESNGQTGSATAKEEALEVYPSYQKKMQATAEPIRLIEKINGGASGVDRVVDCCVDAACSYFPLGRYVIGYDALLINYVLVYVPDWIVDRVQTLQG